jgi:tripartite-type tricarboxylate transporter receptor subunit TctC
MKEQGLDVEFYLWVGLFAPKGTPDAIVKSIREAAKAAVANEKFVASIGNLGDTVRYMDQPDFVKFWDEDAKRVEAAVQSIGKVEG